MEYGFTKDSAMITDSILTRTFVKCLVLMMTVLVSIVFVLPSEPAAAESSGATAMNPGRVTEESSTVLTASEAFVAAMDLCRSGRFEKASRFFEDAINLDHPLSDLCRYMHASCHIRQAEAALGPKTRSRHFSVAADSLKTLLKFYRKNPYTYPANYYLGKITLEEGKSAEAADYLETTVRTGLAKPEIVHIYPELPLAGAYDLLIRAYEKNKAWSKATDAFFERASALWLKENSFVLKELFKTLKKRYKLPYVEARYRETMASLYFRMNDFAKVAELLAGRSETMSKPHLGKILAKSFARLGRHKESISLWKDIMKLRGADGEIARECDFNIASSLYSLGLKEEAGQICVGIYGNHPKSYLADNALLLEAMNSPVPGQIEALERILRNYPQGDCAEKALVTLLDRLSEDPDRLVNLLSATASAADETEIGARCFFEISAIHSREGRHHAAAEALEELSRRHPFDYYGLVGKYGHDKVNSMAAPGAGRERRNYDKAQEITLWKGPGFSDTRAEAALEAGSHETALLELHDAIRGDPTIPGLKYNLCMVYLLAGLYTGAIRYAESFWNDREVRRAFPGLVYMVYPFAWPREVIESCGNDLDPLLVQAIIREESRFDPGDVSWSGAIGLMQIMPATGKWIADKLKDASYAQSRLFEPGFNIAYGCWYLKFLFRDLGEDVFDVAAGYNGGQGSVKKWRRKFDGLPKQAFLESIPFDETRRYVKKVLKSYLVYTRLYGTVEVR